MCIKKLKVLLTVALVAVFTLAVCLFCSQTAYAAPADTEGVEIATESGEIAPVTPAGEVGGETPAEEPQGVTDSVREYLKSIYGDDYEKYYNQIVENWGSVEKFLLNASENLPEEQRYKATELLTTVNAYIGVAADAVLLLCVSIYIIYRSKKNKKISSDLKTLKACSNQTQAAQLALIKSQKAQSASLQALLPGDKFDGAVTELKESDRVLDEAAEEVRKIV